MNTKLLVSFFFINDELLNQGLLKSLKARGESEQSNYFLLLKWINMLMTARLNFYRLTRLKVNSFCDTGLLKKSLLCFGLFFTMPSIAEYYKVEIVTADFLTLTGIASTSTDSLEIRMWQNSQYDLRLAPPTDAASCIQTDRLILNTAVDLLDDGSNIASADYTSSLDNAVYSMDKHYTLANNGGIFTVSNLSAPMTLSIRASTSPLLLQSVTGNSGAGEPVTEKITSFTSTLLGAELVCGDGPTAVTLGEIDLAYVDVKHYVDSLKLAAKSNDELSRLVALWTGVEEREMSALSREELIRQLLFYLDPDKDGRVALFSWETIEQIGSIGFYVEKSSDSHSWVRLNDNLLPAMIAAPYGAEYQLVDPHTGADDQWLYRIVEIEADGNENIYGPFWIED